MCATATELLLEADQTANVADDGVEANGCIFIGSMLFKFSVEHTDGGALASGKMREYSVEEFELAEEAPRRLVKVSEKG